MLLTNQALSIKQMKEIVNKLGWNNIFDIGLYSKMNFNNNKPKIILIQSDNNPLYGHWCMFFDNIFFDASGNKPLELWKKYKLDNIKQNADNLFNYFTKFNDIDYNNYDFQKSLLSQTCGHHSLVRYYFKDLNNEQYKNFLISIKKKYNYKNFDDLIVDVLNIILNN